MIKQGQLNEKQQINGGITADSQRKVNRSKAAGYTNEEDLLRLNGRSAERGSRLEERQYQGGPHDSRDHSTRKPEKMLMKRGSIGLRSKDSQQSIIKLGLGRVKFTGVG